MASLVSGSTLLGNTFTNRNGAFTPNIGVLERITLFGTDNEGNVYIVTFPGDVFILEPNP